MTSGHALHQIDTEMARVRERWAVCERELARLAAERAAQEEIVGTRRGEIAEIEARRMQLEQEAAAAQAMMASLRENRDLAAQAVSERKAQAATLEERHRSAASVLARIAQLVAEMRARMESLGIQIEAAAAEKAQRELENLAIAEKLVDLEAERNACEVRGGLLEFESEQARARLAELDALLRDARRMLDTSRDRKAELSTTLVKLQSDSEYLAQTCVNDLGVQRVELMSDATLPRVSGDELAAEEQACQEMRVRLDAIENTMATIKEIDTFSRQKFEEAFNKINENFQVTFKKLFGGGNAFMRLTDLENSQESGIDVVASPPGKRLQNVLLLSGGEKAMTALALLVGIFQYQPSPFCILDEVDAPLDEANIGRFTQLVEEISVRTQFVLITHSKKTMSIAPVLYGVTMQEPGVSKLVSVRFGATAQASA